MSLLGDSVGASVLSSFGQDKVFCIGLPRTGTTSMVAAGEILGYKGVHTNVAMVWEIAVGNLTIQHGTDGLNFFGDEPYCSFWKTFYLLYPKAKFILTVRDIHLWLKSMHFMFNNHQQYWDETIKKFQLNVWKITPWFWVDEIDDNFLTKWYWKHYLEVTQTIPTKQLLIFNLEEKDKWKRLCTFLNKPIPKKPFPYLNKGEKK